MFKLSSDQNNVTTDFHFNIKATVIVCRLSFKQNMNILRIYLIFWRKTHNVKYPASARNERMNKHLIRD